MFVYNIDFYNKIAQLSINHFKSLPKTGKPTLQDWTILSTIVKRNNNKLEVVALGTGTKCIGANKMSANGDILNDSHAEIICRRAFLRYLYHQLKSTSENNNPNTIFVKCDSSNRYQTKQEISFHFFTTHMPCGDASIFLKQNDEDCFGNCILSDAVSKETNDEPSPKRMKMKQEDIFRTGAKCLNTDEKQDTKEAGIAYHTLGAVRTKPGRGDPTLSVSCSDKIAKWSFLGVQGTLLSYFLKTPIYLASITVAGGIPYSEESFLRSLKERFAEIKLPAPYQQTTPVLGQSDISFDFCKSDHKRPCPSSIIWSNVPDRPLEISVNGKKQGVTKKCRNKKEGRLSICKKELLTTFIELSSNLNVLNDNLQLLCYKEIKNCCEYATVWNLVKLQIFCTWTKKDENLLNFKREK